MVLVHSIGVQQAEQEMVEVGVLVRSLLDIYDTMTSCFSGRDIQR